MPKLRIGTFRNSVILSLGRRFYDIFYFREFEVPKSRIGTFGNFVILSFTWIQSKIKKCPFQELIITNILKLPMRDFGILRLEK